jgi:hypothetical protein
MLNTLSRLRLLLTCLFVLGFGGAMAEPILRRAWPHLLLDAVLPPRVLSKTTPEERLLIVKNLSEHSRSDPFYSIVGPGLICSLCALGLWWARPSAQRSVPSSLPPK